MRMKFFSSIVVFALLLTMLSGCIGTDEATESSSAAVTSTEIISEVESNLSDGANESADVTIEPSDGTNESSDEASQPPETEKPDFFTSNGHGELPEPSQLPAYCTATDTKYLYKCEIYTPSAEGFNACVANGILLFFYWEGDFQYCDMVSLETGELIKTIPVDSACRWGQFKNGGFWLADLSNLSVKFYDTQGNETLIKEATEITDVRFPNGLTVTDDGKYLITDYSTGARVEIYNLETGEITTPQIPANLNPWEIYELSRGIYFSSSDGLGYIYNIETGESETTNSENPVGYFHGDICEFLMDGSISLGTVYNEEQYFVSADINSHLQDLEYGVAVISRAFTSDLTFSDLRKGVSIELRMFEDSYGVFTVILENGTALILEFNDNGNSAYIYDLSSALRDEKEITQRDDIVLSESELQNLIDETAEAVYAETGVELIYGSEGNDFDIYDYVGVAEMDLYKIYTAVNTAKSVLEYYPKGMLEEAYSETNKGIKFYLCGSIYGIQQGSIDTAGGVTADINGYIAVALDISDDLGTVIPHELSHVFDNRIQSVSDNGEIDWMYIWETFSPIDNPYIYSYDEYTNNLDFTMYNESDPEDVWFTECYARTFPTEDRACIMEAIFVAEKDAGESDFYSYENLMEKAKLYAYILRQCFPSCNTENINYWETNLGDIDTPVLPDVLKPVPVG